MQVFPITESLEHEILISGNTSISARQFEAYNFYAVKEESLVRLWFGKMPFEANWRKKVWRIYCTPTT